MKIVIEFYRTRNVDDAHAVVGRERKEAVNAGDAIETARQLSQTLDMPQRDHRCERRDTLFRRHRCGSCQ